MGASRAAGGSVCLRRREQGSASPSADLPLDVHDERTLDLSQPPPGACIALSPSRLARHAVRPARLGSLACVSGTCRGPADDLRRETTCNSTVAEERGTADILDALALACHILGAKKEMQGNIGRRIVLISPLLGNFAEDEDNEATKVMHLVFYRLQPAPGARLSSRDRRVTSSVQAIQTVMAEMGARLDVIHLATDGHDSNVAVQRNREKARLLVIACSAVCVTCFGYHTCTLCSRSSRRSLPGTAEVPLPCTAGYASAGTRRRCVQWGCVALLRAWCRHAPDPCHGPLRPPPRQFLSLCPADRGSRTAGDCQAASGPEERRAVGGEERIRGGADMEGSRDTQHAVSQDGGSGGGRAVGGGLCGPPGGSPDDLRGGVCRGRGPAGGHAGGQAQVVPLRGRPRTPVVCERRAAGGQHPGGAGAGLAP